jgi:hypothetical protein
VLNFGTTSAADSLNTEMLTSREGQIKAAAYVTSALQLPTIDPAWLDQPTVLAKRDRERKP